MLKASKPAFCRQRGVLQIEDNAIADWFMEDGQAAFKAWLLDETDVKRRAAFDALAYFLSEDERVH